MIIRDNPKSHILGIPSSVIRTFSLLRQNCQGIQVHASIYEFNKYAQI